jgi:lantibiotic modifying enzyme
MDVNITSFSREQCITNILLLNSEFIGDLGLMHGKMGIAVYFFHLARETQDSTYKDFANKLIDKIYEEISISTPLDFENGLAGIGWGIEYLVQGGFIEGDTDEVLGELDNQLHFFKESFQRIEFLNGLVGLGAYFLKRIRNRSISTRNAADDLKNQMLLYVINELQLQVKNTGTEALIHGQRHFNLTWDYALIVYFLLEVYPLNIYNLEVYTMVRQLVIPLLQEDCLPKLHSHCLFLKLIIEKIKRSNIINISDFPLDELNRNIDNKFNKTQIEKELIPNSAFLLDGTSGIEWIYLQLYQLTGNTKHQDEALQWKSTGMKLKKSEQGYAGFNVVDGDEQKAFGLLNGLAGIGMTRILEKATARKIEACHRNKFIEKTTYNH